MDARCRQAVRAAAVCLWMLVTGVTVAAHPLGNFTSNHLTRIDVAPEELRAHYVLDDAEIPTFVLLRTLDDGGQPSRATLDRWAAQRAREIADQLVLTVDGRAARWEIGASTVELRPGAGGLPALYATADLRAALTGGPHRIAFRDTTFPGKIGWKDVVVAPAREPTNELRAYPDALLGSPRNRTAIVLERDANGSVAVTGAGSAPAVAAAPVARTDALSALFAHDPATPLAFLAALAFAAVLGALHALEPGHGKTLLSVSLVGARATPSQAAVLAVALTLAHTLGVIALGIVCLAFARYLVPETVYPWMTLGSGILVTLLGARALRREIERRRRAREHRRFHERYPGAHDRGHEHDHGHDHDAVPGSGPIRFREALLAATGGNIAPCPAALVVLLAAIASHRIGFGLTLIVAFGIGLAAALTLIGIAVVRGAAWLGRRPRIARFAHVAPLVTAATMLAIGAWTIGQGAVAQGLVPAPFAPTHLTALSSSALSQGDQP